LNQGRSKSIELSESLQLYFYVVILETAA